MAFEIPAHPGITDQARNIARGDHQIEHHRRRRAGLSNGSTVRLTSIADRLACHADFADRLRRLGLERLFRGVPIMFQGSRAARHDRSRKRSFTPAACGPHGLGVDPSTISVDRSAVGSCPQLRLAASIAASPSRAGSNGRVSAITFSQAFESATISLPNRRPPAVSKFAIGKESSMPRLAGKVAFITGADLLAS